MALLADGITVNFYCVRRSDERPRFTYAELRQGNEYRLLLKFQFLKLVALEELRKPTKTEVCIITTTELEACVEHEGWRSFEIKSNLFMRFIP